MRLAALPVLATALLLAACGGGSTSTTHSGSASASSTTSSATASSTTSSATQGLSVSPPAPTPTSRVTFTFRAPATAGHHGPSLLSFILTLAGPRHAGCVGPRTAPIPHVVKGTTASVQLGGTWCVGAYVARVQEFARPFCKPGQMCPQYVRLIGTVAVARFRVAAP
jgi:hypothetical protein